MPTLEFKGKQFVYTHHLSVPFRTLEVDAAKSLPRDGIPSLNDNLIIQGDNLHALKTLLPTYAGKVKCIYIDPPYNTGNEGWCYNDKVNAPLMREWLKKEANPVDKEDLERHDKWLCMMWPRLQLLKELLADDGVIFISIDDNEGANLRGIMDELFGEGNFIANCIWHKMDSPKNTAIHFSSDHDYVTVYAKNAEYWRPNLLQRSEEMVARYKNPDNDPRGDWLLSDLAARNHYTLGLYSITTPSGRIIEGPPQGSYWRVSKEKFIELDKDNRIWWGDSGKNRPGIKRFLSEVKEGIVPQTIWHWRDVGSTRNSKQALSQIMSSEDDADLFITPKPVGLIRRILDLSTDKQSIILDSFAGSGTTAHAVLELNKKDGGNRKFILVEMENYADPVTAERVRRVINGVPTAKDEALKKGLGGSFTYCTLGEEINIASLLKGESVPSYEVLARYVFYTATGKTLGDLPKVRPDWFIGETDLYTVHLIYQPDREFLRGQDAALNAEMVDIIAGGKGRKAAKKALVFAAVKFMGQKELTARNIEFCQLPYAIHRILGD